MLGTREFARLLDLVSADRKKLMVGIAPEEYASTVSVLERMARNLGWTPLGHTALTAEGWITG
jgi:hypothetical protein